jgi:hypothetical protein
LAPKPAPPRPPKHPAPKPGGKPGGGGITVGGKHISSRTLLVGGLALGVLVFLYIRNRNAASSSDTGASTLAPSGIDPLSGSGTDQGGSGGLDTGQVTPPDFAPDPVFIPSPFPTPAGGGGLPPPKPTLIPPPVGLPPPKPTAVTAAAASSPVTTTAGVSLAPAPALATTAAQAGHQEFLAKQANQAATGTYTAGF